MSWQRTAGQNSPGCAGPPVFAPENACSGVGDFQKRKQIGLLNLVPDETVIRSRKNTLSQRAQDRFIECAGVENLFGRKDPGPGFRGIILPVGLDPHTVNIRTSTQPFSQGNQIHGFSRLQVACAKRRKSSQLPPKDVEDLAKSNSRYPCTGRFPERAARCKFLQGSCGRIPVLPSIADQWDTGREWVPRPVAGSGRFVMSPGDLG